MTVTLHRENSRVHFVGSKGPNEIHLDGAPEIGGENKGFRPTQVLLYAVGGCAVFDFTSMLYKQNLEIEDISVEVTGERVQEGPITPFSAIHIKFTLVGNSAQLAENRALIESFAKRAVHQLCSVGATIRKETPIDFTVELL